MSTTMMSRLMLHIHEVIAAPPLSDTTIGDFEALESDAAQVAEHSANARQSIPQAGSRDVRQHFVMETQRSMQETV